MRRLVLCGVCIGSIAAVCVAVIMAVGIEIHERAKWSEEAGW